MTQKTAFEFTREEVLGAFTDAINREYRYRGYKPDGVALAIEPLPNGGWRITWGDKLEVEETVEIAPLSQPATSAPVASLEPATMEF